MASNLESVEELFVVLLRYQVSLVVRVFFFEYEQVGMCGNGESHNEHGFLHHL